MTTKKSVTARKGAGSKERGLTSKMTALKEVRPKLPVGDCVIPTKPQSITVIEGGERCVVDTVAVAGIFDCINVHILVKNTKTGPMVAGVIEALPTIFIGVKEHLHVPAQDPTSESVRFPGYFWVNKITEEGKGLIDVFPFLNEDFMDPWGTVKAYAESYLKARGEPREITAKEIHQGIDACVRGISEKSYAPRWLLTYEERRDLSYEHLWIPEPGRNKKRGGMMKLFQSFGVYAYRRK